MDKQQQEEGTLCAIDFAKRGGLVPAVVQDVGDGCILMLAYVNAQALQATLDKGMATFWSTSRHCLWTKGETSGDYLQMVEVLVDCDQDALIYRVRPQGAGACHTRDPVTAKARSSCFYRRLRPRDQTLEFL